MEVVKKASVQRVAISVLCLMVIAYLYLILISAALMSTAKFSILIALGVLSLSLLLKGLWQSFQKSSNG